MNRLTSVAPQGGTGVWGSGSGTRGTYYFDAFESRRSTYIGAASPNPVITTINYVYDPLYRLKEANYSDGRYFRYTYDAVGNRLTETKCVILPCTTPVTNTYLYDAANRLTSVNGQTYTWDNNGNLLNDGTSTYTYDAANRLKTVTSGGTTSSYTYNGLNDRLTQTVNSTTTNYVLDLNTGLTQVLSDGTNTYLYGNGRIGEQQPGGFVYHLGDALGSVRQLTNASATVTLARNFEPYGKVLASVGTGSTVMSFTGEMLDSTNLLYLRTRWLRTDLGRFTSKDTWRDYNRPLTLNGWNYVEGDPINRVDPLGQYSIRSMGDLHYLNQDTLNALKHTAPLASLLFSINKSLLRWLDSLICEFPDGYQTSSLAPSSGMSRSLLTSIGSYMNGSLVDTAPFNHQMFTENVAGDKSICPTTSDRDKVCYAIVQTIVEVYDPVTGTIKPMSWFELKQVPCGGSVNGRPLMIAKKMWSCTAQCNLVNFGGVADAPERVTGEGSGSSEDEACRNAKRDAVSQAPRGTYARHCKCTCEKG